MPKEKIQRGRRGERQKRKLNETQHHDDAASKRLRTFRAPDDDNAATKIDVKQRELGHGGDIDANLQFFKGTVFYGLLTAEEQSYFKRADQMLEFDQFMHADERTLFLDSLWLEVNGKELKVACSQSCSRLLERLIGVSTAVQLKLLFQRLRGHFLDLVQHRFASHCCEALFLRSAPIITDELVAGDYGQSYEGVDPDPGPSMESLLLDAIDELERDVGYLMTHQYGSHSLRLLILLLAGRPLNNMATAMILRSKNKERITSAAQDSASVESRHIDRSVPSSFSNALEKIQTQAIETLDTSALRTLATHKLASPVLQLLLEIELSRQLNSECSLMKKLLPNVPQSEDAANPPFVHGLLYDPIGSHMLESVLQYAPGTIFKPLYRASVLPNLRTIARNDVASFVLTKAIERLGSHDLDIAIKTLTPEVTMMIANSRTSLLRCVLERCAAKAVDCSSITTQLQNYFDGPGPHFLQQMLQITDENPSDHELHARPTQSPSDSVKMHWSLLAQSMIALGGRPREVIFEGLLAVDKSVLLEIAKHRSATHVAQAALTQDGSTNAFRRNFIANFSGLIPQMTLDAVASHVVDALWTATSNLRHVRDTFAEEMLPCEAEMKASPCGKAVWRNWSMDLYKRHRAAWVAKSKATEKARATKTEKRVKSNLEGARERFAKCHPRQFGPTRQATSARALA